MSTHEFLPFRPALGGVFLRRFLERARALVDSPTTTNSPESPEDVIAQEIAWATGEVLNPSQRMVYRAVWSLVGDLLRAGWTPRMNDGRLEIAPPVHTKLRDPEQIRAVKAQIRSVMSDARLAKIGEARDFILAAEQPSSGGRARVPISQLVADGPALARDLDAVAALPKDERGAALASLVRPYLQLVTDDGRCEETGLRLKDIWRYFRLTWSTPAETTPGRTMLYLVRDGARQHHPVIALISLENAPIRVRARDDYIGWTVEALTTELKGATPEQARVVFDHLLAGLDRGLAELDMSDLCTPEECSASSRELLEKLAQIVVESVVTRDAALHRWRSGEAATDEERSDLGNISVEAERALYRRKRADAAGRILSARVRLRNVVSSPDFDAIWPAFLASDSGQGAVRAALLAVKSRHIGTSLLELNVCGAIPPYNEILGGKLAALLALSPRVVADYRARYGERPSDIASKLKGVPVVRPADLVYIGTTSLYAVGASQYNRLAIPDGVFAPGSPSVRWAPIGETGGYGTFHISRRTLQALEEAETELNGGVQRVNHVFGEGPSPKLRLLKSALNSVMTSTMGSDVDELARHSMRRLVYGAWLAPNGRDYLLERTTQPSYPWGSDADPDVGTDRVVDYWRTRWLASRLDHRDALDRLREFDPDSIRVGQILPEVAASEFQRIEPPMIATTPVDLHQIDPPHLAFVRNLYRGASAYADGTGMDLLRRVHIPTELESAILAVLETGRDVILTGNPGDGKTHLLRLLEDRIATLPRAPEMVLDASSISNADLRQRWEAARAAGRPVCAAINEAILFRLATEYPDFEPFVEARDQAAQAVLYGDEEIGPDQWVTTFDLSRRNVLAAEVVTAAIDRLTDEDEWPRCARCPRVGCDYTRHRPLLRDNRVRDRLQALLDRVSRRGYHATLRELQAVIAFLLLGDQTCEQMIRLGSGHDQGLFHRLYERGEGELFEQLRETFDPAAVSHPVWDEALLTGDTQREDWVAEAPTYHDALEPSDLTRFKGRKRVFYFCHKDGDQLLSLAGDDEGRFGAFLGECADAPSAARRRLGRLINRFFGEADAATELRIWESHRFNQAPRRTIYSALKRPFGQFEIVRPRLRPSMGVGFAIAEDHVLFRLKSQPHVRLRVDFPLFELLLQAEAGVPALSLEGDATRRLWRFMEELSLNAREQESRDSEVPITLLNRATHERMVVIVDVVEGRYVAISKSEG
jgi:hypothetical protein